MSFACFLFYLRSGMDSATTVDHPGAPKTVGLGNPTTPQKPVASQNSSPTSGSAVNSTLVTVNT